MIDEYFRLFLSTNLLLQVGGCLKKETLRKLKPNIVQNNSPNNWLNKWVFHFNYLFWFEFEPEIFFN